MDLSVGEWKVCVLIPGGKTNKEIANELGISEKTVKFHLTRIYKKCGCKNRGQLSLKVQEFTGKI